MTGDLQLTIRKKTYCDSDCFKCQMAGLFHYLERQCYRLAPIYASTHDVRPTSFASRTCTARRYSRAPAILESRLTSMRRVPIAVILMLPTTQSRISLSGFIIWAETSSDEIDPVFCGPAFNTVGLIHSG